MYKPEVHRTVDRVQLLEQLDFDLTITDEAYRSEHSMEGELRVFRQADDETVSDREQPPTHVLGPILEPIKEAAVGDSGGSGSSAFPGTRLFVGLARETPVKQDEGGFQDDYVTEAMSIESVPENGTVEFDTDWQLEEAKQSVADGITKVDEKPYAVTGLPSDHLPIIVRGELHRDARRLAEVLGMTGHDDMRGRQQFEGLAALTIEIEHRETSASGNRMRIDGFRLEMSRTFPGVDFYRNDSQQGHTYDPENKRVEWGNDSVRPGQTTRYAVVGPIGELLSIDRVNATLRAKIDGQSLSGMTIAGVFDESGESVPDAAGMIDETVRVTADVEIDPSALRGEAQEVSNATVGVNTTPQELFDRVVDICDRNGVHIIDRKKPGDGNPIPGRDGVFEISSDDENHGKLSVRREYGDEGVVYADLVVEGRFTAETEEQQVSAFDETEDRLVRRTEGGLDERGQSTIDIKARSASSELNSRFISIIEGGFGGGA